jgi:hypothetical protein
MRAAHAGGFDPSAILMLNNNTDYVQAKNPLKNVHTLCGLQIAFVAHTCGKICIFVAYFSVRYVIARAARHIG